MLTLPALRVWLALVAIATSPMRSALSSPPGNSTSRVTAVTRISAIPSSDELVSYTPVEQVGDGQSVYGQDGNGQGGDGEDGDGEYGDGQGRDGEGGDGQGGDGQDVDDEGGDGRKLNSTLDAHLESNDTAGTNSTVVNGLRIAELLEEQWCDNAIATWRLTLSIAFPIVLAVGTLGNVLSFVTLRSRSFGLSPTNLILSAMLVVDQAILSVNLV